MKISVIGAGWFGRALALQLKQAGHTLVVSTRDSIKASQLEQQGLEAFILGSSAPAAAGLLDSELIVLNIPPFADQLEWLMSWNWKYQQQRLIFISSTSVYGDSTGVLTETSPLRPDTPNGRIIVSTEEWVLREFSQRQIIRFGGLLGPDRHPGKFLSGRKNIADGDAPVNLLHLDDAVGFVMKVIEHGGPSEIINLVSDEHSTRKEFYSEYAERNNLPLPEFQAGGAEGKLINNDLAKTIYQFKWPKLSGRSL
jgi:nucleoside-diphosphate-sugar epimerase